LCKIHLVSESRKVLRRSKLTGGQLLNANPLTVLPDSFNRFNPLTEANHLGNNTLKLPVTADQSRQVWAVADRLRKDLETCV